MIGTKKLQRLMWSWMERADLDSTSLLVSSLRCLNTLNHCVSQQKSKKMMEKNAQFYKRLCTYEFNLEEERTKGEKKILSDRVLLSSWIRSFVRFNVRLRRAEAWRERAI